MHQYKTKIKKKKRMTMLAFKKIKSKWDSSGKSSYMF